MLLLSHSRWVAKRRLNEEVYCLNAQGREWQFRRKKKISLFLELIHILACTINNCHDDHKWDATIWSIAIEFSITLIEVSFTLLEASVTVQASLAIVTYNHHLQSYYYGEKSVWRSSDKCISA